MSQKPRIYWARPITTYARTHLQAIQKIQNEEEPLVEDVLSLHCDLYPKCVELEQKVYQYLTSKGYEVVDPGSDAVASDFETWRNQLDVNKANPMPFFTDLAESCDAIIFSCFDDSLQSENAPAARNRIGCGVVKEVHAWANKNNVYKINCLSYNFDNLNDISVATMDWPKIGVDADFLCDNHTLLQNDQGQMLVCLDYPQTKSLLLLQGYKSRSSKHKKA